MPSPDGERIDELAKTIMRLQLRVERIDDRLARLERQQPAGELAEQYRPEPPQSEPPRAEPLSAPAISPPLRVAEPPPQAGGTGIGFQPTEPLMNLAVPAFTPHEAPPVEAADHQQLETRMGLTWINRIGVITLIIGVAFFFKYAIDNQWIGETGRVVLGVFAGLAIVAAGDVLWRRNQRVFAQGMCGLGVGILSFYASFDFYHLLPQAVAFVLMAMVTALAGALALRYEALAIAALGLFGGYSTPVLLSTGVDAPWTFFSYIFLLDVGAVAVARPHRWRLLNLIAFLATSILYMSWFGDWFKPEKR